MTMQGSELKAIREALGWTQRKFAEAIGMTQTYISHMEAGKRPIERRTELAARYLAWRFSAPSPTAVEYGEKAAWNELQRQSAVQIDIHSKEVHGSVDMPELAHAVWLGMVKADSESTASQ